MAWSDLNWFIGVSLAIFSNIISNIGVNFQKKAHSYVFTLIIICDTNGYTLFNSNREKQLKLRRGSTLETVSGTSLKNIFTNKTKQNLENDTSTFIGNDMKLKKAQKSYVTDKYWIIGLFGQVLGALCDFAALAFAPQSVVAPLGSLTLVVNVCLSPVMHKEIPSMKTLIATIIIIFGSAVTVFFSTREDSIDKLLSILLSS